METLLIIAGSIIAASGTLPYIIATVRGTTKPRIITWATWSLLTGMASWAAFSDGQLTGGLFALMGAVSTCLIVLFGLRYADRSFEKIDAFCLGGVITGLALWLLFSNPAIGVWAAIIIDFIGLVPTARHAWRAPHEETAITYAAVLVGGALAVAPAIASGNTSVTAIGYPLYAAISLGLVTVTILWRRSSLAAVPAQDSTQPAQR